MSNLARRRQTGRAPTIRVAGKRALAVGIILAAALAPSAAIAAEPKAESRLVTCEAGSCLLVTGHRANVRSIVSINGHAVQVEGRRNWRVRVPVDTLREWSTPFARSITVSIADAEAGTNFATQARLPIGLLGHSANLASLVVRLK